MSNVLYNQTRSKSYEAGKNTIYYENLANVMIETVKEYNTSPKHILDLCCGTGLLTAKLSSYFETSEISGTDISAEMLAIAKEKLPGVSFFEQDVNTLNLQGVYDIITCNYGFQWLHEDFPKSLKKICSPNTTIIASIPAYSKGSQNISSDAMNYVGNRLFQILVELSNMPEVRKLNLIKEIILTWRNQLSAEKIATAMNNYGFKIVNSFHTSHCIEYENAKELVDNAIARGMFGSVLDQISDNLYSLFIRLVEKEMNARENKKEEILSDWIVIKPL